ncbi:hypothetical protein HU200_045152 [Digitaria exilis]|uniref:GIR1-like zinc ribbon domain-containing protein n=1 Tax=Digitaria exilis TaxID=1010633 RepID=A0A835EEK3_9POAL|nr:hypothetical protein HU200_045152 [Digitaria exilis]CAB3493801.1 unnamed protein product [Digitaria exilis]CAB3498786.1 unnamed protein product [Digitaria exilis]
MAAEAVGFMARGANGGRAGELVTRDFLGGCATADDARDAAVRHDAVPGKLSLQKHACPATPRDLNLFPVASGAATKPCAVTTAPAPTSSSGPTTTYHSVCTIEKVKTALERFERGKQGSHNHQQQHSGAGASPSSSSVTTSSVKRRGGDSSSAVEQGDGCDSPSGGGGGGGMVAAACPRCFLYVLISRSDPRCPRCESHVPAPPVAPPAVSKKPRIDLNVGFLGT